MTIESRLAEIRARAENATPGPWDVRQYPQGGGRVSTPDGYPLPGCFNCGENDAVYEEGDAEFIAHARTDLPALLAAVEAFKEKCDRIIDEFEDPAYEANGYALGAAAVARTLMDTLTAELGAQDTTREDQPND